MTDNFSNNKRIAKNTIFLYFRTFFTMAVSIYTSRIVLEQLGVEDYGIYNVVGGIVAMLSMFKNSLSASSQRFFSYELGKGSSQLNNIFSATLGVHFIITIILFFFFETIGLWFLNNKINISLERMIAANWVFQCSIISFSINLICIPYVASIIAHEKMSAFAFIGIYEACARLGLAYMLSFFTYDKLIVYALLMLAVSLSLRFIYGLYCKTNFKECVFRLSYNKELYKKLFSFTGWNVFGATAGILNTYGINILVNIFFDVTFNAARGIAEQVTHAVNHFVSNFTMALNPQITKNYSSGNYKYSSQLVIKGSKYSALLLWFIALPIIMQVDFILGIWLVEVPTHAALFVKFALLYALCNSLSLSLYYGILATGEIRDYHILVTLVNLLAFPLCYFAFRFGAGAEWGYIAAIISMLLSLIARVFMLVRKFSGFISREYYQNTILRVALVLFLSYYIVNFCESRILLSPIMDFFVMTPIVLIINSLIILFIGLDRTERSVIKKACLKLIH